MKLTPTAIRFAAHLLATFLFGCCLSCGAPGSATSGPSGELPVEGVGPLLIVGIDGASFDRLLPLAQAGRTPNLKALMDRGAWGPLETLEPTVSPAIWTTVATGRLPAEHGILGFEGVPGQTMTTLPTSQMRRVRAFWNILSEGDRSVGVIGWWATWPAEPVRGYIVSDRMAYTRMEAAVGREAAGPLEVHPAELAAPLAELVRKPNEITAEEVRAFMPLSDEEVEGLIRGSVYRHGEFLPEFKYVHQSDRSTADMAVYLLNERPTDVTAVAFYGVDTVSHLAWHFTQPERFPSVAIDPADIEKYGGLIDNYYVYIDRLLGELLAAAPDDVTVIVFSDHGFGPTGQLPWSGGHGRITPGAPIAPDGILILAGPSIRPEVRLERPHVLDLAPMLLYLQGFPLSKEMPLCCYGSPIRQNSSAHICSRWHRLKKLR